MKSIEEKRKNLEAEFQRLFPEEAQQSRSDSLDDFPDAISPMMRERSRAPVLKDEIYAYADLLLKERTRKELWQAFPDDLWGRDPREPHLFPKDFEKGAREQQASWRYISFCGREAVSRFHFEVGWTRLKRITVTLNPIVLAGESDDADVRIWRQLKTQIDVAQFVRRKERENWLEMVWLFRNCPLRVRFGKTDSELSCSSS